MAAQCSLFGHQLALSLMFILNLFFVAFFPSLVIKALAFFCSLVG
jgi:hypothetical protein